MSFIVPEKGTDVLKTLGKVSVLNDIYVLKSEIIEFLWLKIV